jgi:3-oxoacyl-[acyl-carrier-protein] synthase-3
VQQQLGLRDDQVYNNIQRYGNTTAASIPIALSEAVRDGSIQRGDTLCLAAFGAGFTWASAILEY